MAIISASILAADLSRLKEELERVKPFIDEIHLDVMDGHFVPNLTFGYPMIETLRTFTDLPIDAHLMVTNPDDHIKLFIEKGATRVTIHQETCYHLHRSVELIKSLGAEAFVAINPATSIYTLEEILSYADGILVMTVNPGFSGQKFIPTMMEKIKRLNEIRKERNLSFKIAVDGGVGNSNAQDLINIGVNILVMGYGVFRNDKLHELNKFRM
ncbi:MULTISPECIES: ribulose-phosphate 3-epimerase [Fervidobacterium]|uniref:Ribulose-phosphate 3-epimerase n=1 Tax=Fervidobacterium nodosum (strain ATCC 35602 / DSM 5306 / Rt17-B1) TaxID=381764 RepID=A7HLQ2_FERNB|nr:MULTISPECIES: ribulose-phosphate 3-epimerase [Fervidobacterium]ABS60835.1 Ribulose-phosphate 3-epimerase [Fervidobacterium nodosum Rt17-B1]KAF2962033.1 ribulose phosphate epimerase [Fervidobacterium sp. 2310opik-2]PHJ13659.1 ribulose-phosphate 3-epimerase [Fervidobacterium sp. SC_NGM5_G05]HOJ94978.1 ribulose-phosphate 3-epimerase [Fervidobacterium nodosum]